MNEQQACTLCGAGGHTAAQCNWRTDAALDKIRAAGLTIDGDNAYKRDLLDCVVGALAFGFQGRPAPEETHWLHRFWEIGNAEREARAALAQPSPAPELELERPEVVAWQYRVTAGPQTGWSLWHPGKGEEYERSYTVERRQLMTVAQHDRVVGALLAEIKDADGLSKMLGDLLREIDIATRGPEPALTRSGYPDLPQRVKTLVEERNAAQAKVADLESQLLDASSERNAMQRQRDNERSMFERECDDADELIRLIGFDPEQCRTDGGSVNLPKLRAAIAPVAPAGQVPELDQLYSMLGADDQVDAAKKIAELVGCRLSRSALTEAQMRRLYENSTEAENERLGFAAFARLIRRAEAVHQIAAAPAQGGE